MFYVIYKASTSRQSAADSLLNIQYVLNIEAHLRAMFCMLGKFLQSSWGLPPQYYHLWREANFNIIFRLARSWPHEFLSERGELFRLRSSRVSDKVARGPAPFEIRRRIFLKVWIILGHKQVTHFFWESSFEFLASSYTEELLNSPWPKRGL